MEQSSAIAIPLSFNLISAFIQLTFYEDLRLPFPCSLSTVLSHSVFAKRLGHNGNLAQLIELMKDAAW